MTESLDWERAWDKPEPQHQQPTSIAPAPSAGTSRYALAALDSELERLRNAANGTRNDTLNRAGYSLSQLVAAGHLKEADVRDALRATALDTGLDEHEVDATLRSSLGAGAQQPRAVPAQTEIRPAAVIEAPDLDPSEAETFWKARAILQDVHDWARARRVSPWAVLGVTLARIVTATPPHVVLPPIVGSYASLNLFVGLVGPSGSGKGAAESVAAEAVDVGLLTTRTAGSGEGIAHAYVKRTRQGLEDLNTAVLFTVPEVDSLAALGSRQGATLLPELRKAWSGEQLGFAYADPAKNLVVRRHMYRLCMIVGIQPGRAGALLDDTDGGTPQRFLWLPATDPEAPDLPPTCPPATSWTAPTATDLGYATPGGLNPIDVCTPAQDLVIAEALARTRGEREALDGHALLCRLKVAAAMSLADGRVGVSVEDWQLADVIMRKSAATRSDVVRVLSDAVAARNRGRANAEADRAITIGEKVADAAIGRVCRSVVKVLRRENDWMSEGAIRRTLNSRDRGVLNEALERLIEAGQIEVEETSKDTDGSGGNGLKYRISGGVT